MGWELRLGFVECAMENQGVHACWIQVYIHHSCISWSLRLFVFFGAHPLSTTVYFKVFERSECHHGVWAWMLFVGEWWMYKSRPKMKKRRAPVDSRLKWLWGVSEAGYLFELRTPLCTVKEALLCLGYGNRHGHQISEGGHPRPLGQQWHTSTPNEGIVH